MQQTRLKLIDGLRGFSIFLVIINHVPFKTALMGLPPIISHVLSILLTSGKIGVGIFFALTGYFMARQYPDPRSFWVFLNKRYRRLMPQFLIWVLALTLAPQIFKDNQAIGVVLLAVLLAMVLKKFWLNIKKWHYFIVVQVMVGIGYLIFSKYVPAPIYYFTYPEWLKSIITALVNGTLNLPWGRYIPQLDGVYWALITELCFYILYPTVIVPIINYHKQFKAPLWKVGLLISTIAYCFGLLLIARHFFNWQIIQPFLFSYMIVGVVVGSNFELFKSWVNRISKFLRSAVWIGVILLLLMFLPSGLNYFIPSSFGTLNHIGGLIPLGWLIVLLITRDDKLKPWFGQSWWVFLGTISYPLYLTHSTVIQIVWQYIQPKTSELEWISLGISFGLSILIALIFYYIYERPNLKKGVPVSDFLKDDMGNRGVKLINKRFHKVVLGIIMVTSLVLWLAYRTPVALMATVQTHMKQSLVKLWSGDQKMNISNSPLKREFIAHSDGLGMITFHLKGSWSENMTNISEEPSKLVARLMDENLNILAETKYRAPDIYEDRYHPFGFPIQTHSKGKKYFLELTMEEKDRTRIIELIVNSDEFRSVYFNERSKVLRDPQLLGWILLRKILDPLDNQEFWLAFWVLFPLPLMLVLTPRMANKLGYMR